MAFLGSYLMFVAGYLVLGASCLMFVPNYLIFVTNYLMLGASCLMFVTSYLMLSSTCMIFSYLCLIRSPCLVRLLATWENDDTSLPV